MPTIIYRNILPAGEESSDDDFIDEDMVQIIEEDIEYLENWRSWRHRQIFKDYMEKKWQNELAKINIHINTIKIQTKNLFNLMII